MVETRHVGGPQRLGPWIRPIGDRPDHYQLVIPQDDGADDRVAGEIGRLSQPSEPERWEAIDDEQKILGSQYPHLRDAQAALEMQWAKRQKQKKSLNRLLFAQSVDSRSILPSCSRRARE